MFNDTLEFQRSSPVDNQIEGKKECWEYEAQQVVGVSIAKIRKVVERDVSSDTSTYGEFVRDELPQHPSDECCSD